MGKIPKQRTGSSGKGGANHRSNYRGFGNSGGSVRPPNSKGCLGHFVLMGLGSIGAVIAWCIVVLERVA